MLKYSQATQIIIKNMTFLKKLPTKSEIETNLYNEKMKSPDSKSQL